jgi:hypothetical protein
MGRKAGTRTGLVLLAAVLAAAAFAVAGRAEDPRFDSVTSSIGPGFVDSGQDVLVKAQWHYVGNRTLVHSFIEFTVPDGWTLSGQAPSVCSQAGTKVTCDRGTIRPGDLIAQSVELRADADLGAATVRPVLNFSEGPRNPGRQDSVTAPDVTTTVIAAGDQNRAGKCVARGGGSVQTDPGAGGSDTTATVPATDQLCTPISLGERPRQNPTEACLPGRVCVTEIVTTDAALFPTSTPIQLKIVFRGNGLNNLPLIFNGGQPDQGAVPACTGPGATPDPCYFDHGNRQQSVTWFVNWSGRDPTWTGGG